MGNLKPFKPGQSGNPGGRPKGIAALAREHTNKAIDVLVAGMDDEDARVRIAAAKEIIDRGFGKAVSMSADVSKHLDKFDDDTLDAAIDVLRAAIGAPETARNRTAAQAKH